MILSSHAFFPIPKSRRAARAKRLISFQEAPLAHKTPEIRGWTESLPAGVFEGSAALSHRGGGHRAAPS